MRKLRMNALSLWIVAPVPPDITMGNGDLVKERPMEAQEMQKTVFEDIESTGTEGISHEKRRTYQASSRINRYCYLRSPNSYRSSIEGNRGCSS